MWRRAGWQGWINPPQPCDETGFNPLQWPCLLPPKQPPKRRGCEDPHRYDLLLSGRSERPKAKVKSKRVEVAKVPLFVTDGKKPIPTLVPPAPTLPKIKDSRELQEERFRRMGKFAPVATDMFAPELSAFAGMTPLPPRPSTEGGPRRRFKDSPRESRGESRESARPATSRTERPMSEGGSPKRSRSPAREPTPTF